MVEKNKSVAKKAPVKKKSPKKKTSSKTAVKKPAPKTKGKAKAVSQKRKYHPAFKWLLRLLILGIILFLMILAWVAPSLPSLDKAFNHSRNAVIHVLDHEGKTIYSQNAGWGEPLHVDEIPKYMSDALISIEDKRFRYHFGIDPYGLSRAIYRNIRYNKREGGSTITQQLAKNIFLTPERTIKRKAQEAILSLWLEWKFTKDQILTIYLNRVYYGTNAWGVDGASQKYFGHSAKELSLWESAMLAGIMRSPNNYNPHSNLERANQRTKLVLSLMRKQKRITEEEYEQAIEEGKNKTYPKIKHNRSYYIDWIFEQAEGFIQTTTTDLIIHTSFNPKAQKEAENILRNYLDQYGKSKNVDQGAILSIATDGSVIAMVGGYDYGQSQFNRTTQARRQPGSSFKPLIWQLALQEGMLLSDMVMDQPLNIQGWEPQNYDRKFHGMMSMKDALSRSSNSVAVQLSQYVGGQKIAQAAYKQSMQTPIEQHRSIALGTSVVTLMDMAALFGSWASGGYAIYPWGIKKITDPQGHMIYQHEHPQNNKILSGAVVAQMNFALSDVIENGTGKNAQLPFDVAGKTGTTQDYRDAWFVGYSSQFVTSVWLGNDDNKPMNHVTGGGLPAKIWHDFMDYIHLPALPPMDLPKPKGEILDPNNPLRELILW